MSSTDSQISVVTTSTKGSHQNPDEKTLLTLISFDKEEFVISESAAALSIKISNMVEDGFTGDGQIPLPAVDGKTLAKVVEFLNYKHNQEINLSVEEQKKLDDDFLDKMDSTEELFDMVLAANYLNIKALLDHIVCQKTADVMENKSVKWVRKMFQLRTILLLGKRRRLVRNMHS